MKYLFFISALVFLTGCNRYPAKSLIQVPNLNYSHNESQLRIDGYYCFEYTSKTNCYDSSTEQAIKREYYDIKGIKTIVLYETGAAYHSGRNGYSTGVNHEDCVLIDSLNTFNQTRINFESQVKKWGLNDDEEYGWYNTGVFNIKNNNEIQIQIYHGAGWVDSYSSVMQYEGQIVSDKLIRIEKIIDLKDQSTIEVDMEFKFFDFDGIEPVNNYILNNRDEFGRK